MNIYFILVCILVFMLQSWSNSNIAFFRRRNAKNRFGQLLQEDLHSIDFLDGAVQVVLDRSVLHSFKCRLQLVSNVHVGGPWASAYVAHSLAFSGRHCRAIFQLLVRAVFHLNCKMKAHCKKLNVKI